jgi:hypothetical protein
VVRCVGRHPPPGDACDQLSVGREAHATADSQAKEAVLRLTLPVGVTTLEAWFADAADAALCGAFFVTVRRGG